MVTTQFVSEGVERYLELFLEEKAIFQATLKRKLSVQVIIQFVDFKGNAEVAFLGKSVCFQE